MEDLRKTAAFLLFLLGFCLVFGLFTRGFNLPGATSIAPIYLAARYCCSKGMQQSDIDATWVDTLNQIIESPFRTVPYFCAALPGYIPTETARI